MKTIMKNMKIEWKLIIILAVIFSIIYIGFYVWILSSVKETVKSISINENKVNEKTVSDNIRNEFLKFNTYPNSESTDEIHFKLSTGKVFHDFLNGTVWVKYTYEGIDTDTKEVKYGSSNVPIKIKVKLDHWKWKLVDKEEEP